MSSALNEKRAFDRRRKSLFRKGYDIQRLFQARVYIIIERNGSYYAYRPSQRVRTWPPDQDAAEIRNAETFFPTDFQTVREAGISGPVLSDTEDTRSHRAPSQGESIHAHSMEADEARYRSLDTEADAYPTGYGHPQDQGRFHDGRTDTAPIRNSIASSAPAEMFDTPMSEIALDDQGRGFHEADEDEEEQKPVIDVNSSPGANNGGYLTADADMSEMKPRHVRHNQSASRSFLSNGNGRVTPHVKGQELLQSIYPSLLSQSGGIMMDSGRSQASGERAAPQSRQQRWPAGNADDGRCLVASDGTQQRLAQPNTTDCARHAASRCQTPDDSPKRVPHPRTAVSASASRSKQSPALNSLPKVPTRRQPKRRV